MVKNHISKVSKMNGVLSWSLPAIECCPGSKDKDGNLVPSCSGCYATTGCYRFTNVKKCRADNKLAWQDSEWAPGMVFTIKDKEYFRWFDSGDCYTLELAKKIYEVMLKTPNTKHWLPTRMWKFSKIKKILEKMNKLPNVVVRYSSDSIFGEYKKGFHGSIIIPSADFETEAYICPSQKNGGKCLNCHACWDKNVSLIAYIAHGYKIEKIYAATGIEKCSSPSSSLCY